MKKRVISTILIICFLAASLEVMGCAEKKTEKTQKEEIPLVDPVGAESCIEKCSYHDLRTITSYFSTVVPEIKEYAFSSSTKLQDVLAKFGEPVHKGDVLVTSDKEDLEKKLKDLKEEIEDFEEQQEEYVLDTEAHLADPRKEVKWLKNLNDSFDDYSENKEYYGAQYQLKEVALRKMEAEYAQEVALYNLEHDYYMQKLENLNKKISDSDVHAGMDGTIVATYIGSHGEVQVQEGDNVVAIGDMNEKLLLCELSKENEAIGAKSIYAVINGKRYELRYRPVSSNKRQEAIKENNAFSVFEFVDDTSDLKIGDFASVIIEKDSREHVLAVPKSAIHNLEGGGSAVYVMQDGKSEEIPVKTGFSDYVYVEIVEGLSEGDKVLLPDPTSRGKKSGKVTKGEFSMGFAKNGYFYYPVAEKVKNKNQYGDMYFGEYKVSLYEHVNQGDVIATVRVKPDPIALERLTIRINRLNARIKDLEKTKKQYKLQEDIRRYEKSLTGMQKEIEKLQKELDERNGDYSVTSIVAPTDGVITWLDLHNSEDYIEENKIVAEITNEASCFLAMEDSTHLLSIGNQVSVKYKDAEGNERDVLGEVANMNGLGLSNELKCDWSVIELSAEDVKQMLMVNQDDKEKMERMQYQIEAEVHKVDSALLIPKDAVARISGNTYVNVLNEDGSVMPTSFVSGGYNNEYYIALSGLTEGMTVCWE